MAHEQDPEDFEVTGQNVRHPTGSPKVSVKAELGEGETAATSPTLRADGDSNGEVVNKPPVKKKRKTVRAASEEMPKPPAPLKTIRLDFTLDLQPQQEYIVFNFMDEAKRAGFIDDLPEDEEEGKMEVDGPAMHSALPNLEEMQSGTATPVATQAGPSSAPSAGAGLGGGILAGLADLSAEELARQLDERDAAFKKGSKVGSLLPSEDFELTSRSASRAKRRRTTNKTRSLTTRSCTRMRRRSLAGRRRRGFSFTLDRSNWCLSELRGAAHALKLIFSEPIKPRPRAAPRKKAAAARPAELQIPTLAEMVEQRYRQTVPNGHGDGSVSSPIKIDDDADIIDGPGPSRRPSREFIPDTADAELTTATRSPSPDPPKPVDRSLYKSAPTDDKYLPPFRDYPRTLRHRLIELKRRSDAHGWIASERSKFPEALKPPLKEVGLAAIKVDMFGEKPGATALWSALPSVLPYNLFTLQVSSSGHGKKDG